MLLRHVLLTLNLLFSLLSICNFLHIEYEMKHLLLELIHKQLLIVHLRI